MTDGDNPADRKSTSPTSTGRRPPHVKPPAHLSKSPPVPEPDPINQAAKIEDFTDPTRYGDWVRKGIAVDF